MSERHLQARHEALQAIRRETTQHVSSTGATLTGAAGSQSLASNARRALSFPRDATAAHTAESLVAHSLPATPWAAFMRGQAFSNGHDRRILGSASIGQTPITPPALTVPIVPTTPPHFRSGYDQRIPRTPPDAYPSRHASASDDLPWRVLPFPPPPP